MCRCFPNNKKKSYQPFAILVRLIARGRAPFPHRADSGKLSCLGFATYENADLFQLPRQKRLTKPSSSKHLKHIVLLISFVY